MKANKIIAVLLIGLAVAACNSKPAGNDIPKEFQPSKSLVDSVSYMLGINLGGFMANYDFGSDLNYSEIVKGIKDFVNAEGSPMDEGFLTQFKIDPNEMTALFNRYLEMRYSGQAMVTKQKSEKFLAENAKKEGIQTTASGLQYKIIEPGSDVKPDVNDTLWMRYKGSLTDGTVFDEVPENAAPARMILGTLVPGMIEGLKLVGEGGKIDLYLPSELGYGEGGAPSIPPHSAIVFNVELTKIGKYVEPEAE